MRRLRKCFLRYHQIINKEESKAEPGFETQAIALANKTGAVAMQNVIFAIGIKVIVMILGLTGIYTNMWLAVFADTGVAFLCILNSIRILRQK